MKKLLIIYNIIFLLTGNVLLSSAHHLLFHNHDSHTHVEFEEHECIECINVENSNNYILDNSVVNFSNNNTNQFVLLYFDKIQTNINISTDSRAPPIKN